MNATSGRGLPVPLGFYDPESQSLRTSAVTFDSDSTPSSPTLPPSGSMRSGALFERRRSALPTSATASSSSPLLPTPRTSDTNGPGVHGDGGMDLRTTVTLLPTPRASDTGTPGRRASEGFRPPLSEVVLPLFPTPRASDGAKGGPNQRGSKGDLALPAVAHRIGSEALLPTPTASDGDRTSPTYGRGNPTLTGAVSPPPSTGGSTPPDDEPHGQLTIAID